ncbi:hypothetical protein ACFVRD_47435 [Streptomyces sp. NPDC057908]|uniref:hypothetical protein n=1 Tax=Streptomyces sp. NPDC057908 TaxID=3346276 RepID=UPI0036E9DDA2
MPENQVVRARKALRLVDQLMAEQPPRGCLAVPADVVEDDPVVLHPPHPPVADLLRGQFLEDQLLAVVDVGGLRLRGGTTATGRGAGSTTGATGTAGTTSADCAAAAPAWALAAARRTR